MNPHTRKYHVVIVHYGDSRATLRLVNALKQCEQSPDTVVVVNHDNHDLSESRLRNCCVVNVGSNKGFAAGVNSGLGALMARGAGVDDIMTCINNDVILKPEAFMLVRRWWTNNPKTALVGFGTGQNNEIHSYGHVNLFTGRPQLFASPARGLWALMFQMCYVHGAFMSAPIRLFVDNNGVPEKYFMYWEDVLFSKQVTKRKFPLKIVSGVLAAHSSANIKKAVSGSENKLYYLVRNGALFLEQETPPPWRAYWFVVNRVRYFYHILRRPQKKIVVEAIRDAINGVTGPRPQ